MRQNFALNNSKEKYYAEVKTKLCLLNLAGLKKELCLKLFGTDIKGNYNLFNSFFNDQFSLLDTNSSLSCKTNIKLGIIYLR